MTARDHLDAAARLVCEMFRLETDPRRAEQLHKLAGHVSAARDGLRAQHDAGWRAENPRMDAAALDAEQRAWRGRP